jgi:glycine cleavage system regulatory protein
LILEIPMHTTLVLTLIGDDRPGLVETLSRTIGAHQGNWLESSMAHLAGKFAGILRVSVPSDQADSLQRALGELPALRVIAEAAPAAAASRPGRRLRFTLVGQDRLGIVREVAAVLARHGVNVEELTTRTESAPMSGETLFHAEAELLGAPTLDPLALQRDLEQISQDLMVDINLEPAD